MKKLILLSVLAFVAVSGCKKKQAVKNEDAKVTEDHKSIQSLADEGISDANTAVGDYNLLTGKTSGSTTPLPSILTDICGASVDTNGLHLGTVKINYNGTVCNNRKREGSIKLTILNHASGMRWKTAGCVLKVEYLDYKVTRSSDGKSVKLNGVANVTNVSGGTWLHILLNTQPNLIHATQADDIKATFEDNKTATYNINRKYTYTWANSVLTCKGEGTGTYNGISELENWGTTRDGDEFTSQVTTPVIWNWPTCGPWRPIEGAINLKVAKKEFDLKCTFGVDASGKVVSPQSNSCPYGWRVDWTYKNKSNKKVFGYN